MTNTEPEENELFTSTPEAEPSDDTESFTDSEEDSEEEYDGQPDEMQEWHDFDPDC
jgi:hypothetical protein